MRGVYQTMYTLRAQSHRLVVDRAEEPLRSMQCGMHCKMPHLHCPGKRSGSVEAIHHVRLLAFCTEILNIVVY